VKELCCVAGVSRSGFYKFLAESGDIPACDKELIDRIRMIQSEAKQIYGYRRMKIAIETELNQPVNHKRIARLQKMSGLQAVIRRKRFNYPKTMFIDEGPKENLLNRDVTASEPNRKWVTDITYLQAGSQRFYMSAILDLFNNELVSYRISADFGIFFVLETVKAAFEETGAKGVLIHSDQGGHYESHVYSKLLTENNATQSMSRRGNCWDNAVMENFFSHLKTELLYRFKPESKEELENMILEYITFYNTKRIQTKMKMAPVAYRSHFSQTA
jgi:putative transposase